jgi:hypothetical protein
MHITARDLQLIPFNTVFRGVTTHYGWGCKTYSVLYCPWCWYCTLQSGIYNLLNSTRTVVVILQIASWDIQLIPFNTVFWCDTAHYSMGSISYSHQYCLWRWYGILQLAIYKLFSLTLFVEMILHIADCDIQLIPYNTSFGCDTANYS